MSITNALHTFSPIRIILAEDHHIVRTGLSKLINAQKDMRIVGEAADGKEVLDLIASGVETDLILTDVDMPVMDGYTLSAHLKELNTNIKILVLSMLDDEKHLKKAFAAGCCGYLTKAVEPDELLFALRQVALGKKYLCTDAFGKLIQSGNFPNFSGASDKKILPDFTSHEVEMLAMIAAGGTNTQIANKMFLSKRTIEGQRQLLLDKTNSKNTAALVRYALINGIIN